MARSVVILSCVDIDSSSQFLANNSFRPSVKMTDKFDEFVDTVLVPTWLLSSKPAKNVADTDNFYVDTGGVDMISVVKMIINKHSLHEFDGIENKYVYLYGGVYVHANIQGMETSEIVDGNMYLSMEKIFNADVIGFKLDRCVESNDWLTAV